MLSQRRETLSKEESRTLKYVLFFLSFSGIENRLSGNFAQTIPKNKKIKFFFPKTTPHSRECYKRYCQLFSQLSVQVYCLPLLNARPANRCAGRSFEPFRLSAKLSTARGHFEAPLPFPILSTPGGHPPHAYTPLG